MNIDEIPAGRELDALIAEKVMGLSKDGYSPVCYVENHAMDEDWCYQCDCMADEAEHVPKRYSTSISAAWEVVEKMSEKFQICLESPWWPGVAYKVRFTRLDGKTHQVSDGDTASLAICRAALKAVAP